jgi:hypothetical protein
VGCIDQPADVSRRQGRITQDRVDTIHSQLEEIHSWFVQNLQGQKAATGPRSPRASNLDENETKRFTFSVSIYRGVRGENQRFYCPRASFRLDWLDLNEPFNATRSIFQCSCNHDGRERAHEKELNVTCEFLLCNTTVPTSHRYVVLPSSLVVRVVGGSKPAWHMYASASVLPNYVSSIYIADVESNGKFPKSLFTLRILIVPKDIAKLEDQSARLAACQANLHLERGQCTGFVSFEPYSTGDALISILDSKT